MYRQPTLLDHLTTTIALPFARQKLAPQTRRQVEYPRCQSWLGPQPFEQPPHRNDRIVVAGEALGEEPILRPEIAKRCLRDGFFFHRT